MKTVLITGAHGFIGRNTARYFSARGYRVIGIGHGHWQFDEPAHYGIDQWIEADIDIATLSDIKESLNCIVHCAGGSSVGYSFKHPLKDYMKTVGSTANILEYMRLYQQDAKLIYPSSAAVYGKKDAHRIKVNSKLEPLSPYGFHKKMAEELCFSYANSFNLSINIIRFFSIYGPGLCKQLLWDACNKFLKSSGKAEFYGTGNETRDWLHIKDAVDLIYFMATNYSKYRIVNGGFGKPTTIKDITHKMAMLYGNGINIYFNLKCKEGDPNHFWADNFEIRKLGWKPKITLDQGLYDYIEWFKSSIKPF